MDSFETALLIAALLTVLSVLTSKASSRLGIPALLLFLIVGAAAGDHGFGNIHFSDYALAQQLGAVALAFILFSGGMSTELKKVRPVLKSALLLSTLGVLVSTFLVALFAYRFLGFSWIEGALLGATISSTDVAAVFTVLRSNKVSLRDRLGPLLELESALNDPMAVFLGVTLLGLAQHSEQSLFHSVLLFFWQMILGAGLGWSSGRIATWLINRLKLEFEGLYPVLNVGWILLTYAATQKLNGSGFLAVYIAGVLIGNAHLLHRKSLIHFHEGIAWLGQIAMFLAMGLLIRPNELWAIAPLGISLSAFLVFIARPLSIFICFPTSHYNAREKLMISWAGLRGAVPIILASYVLVSEIPLARQIFNLVFFVTFFSVLLQGTLIPHVAKWLKVDLPFQEKFRFPLEFNPTDNLKNSLLEIPISAGSVAVGKSLMQLHLPKDVLIVLIQRSGDIVVPRGGTHIQAQDTLLVLSGDKSIENVRKMISPNREPS